MADRKLFGVLSSAQITFLGALAIIAPGAVYAVTSTSVSVTDPITGVQALVDNGRRQYVYDPIAGYANNPQNLVVIYGSTSQSTLNVNTVFYTVPTGKALIIKSANITHYNGVSGADNYTYFYVNNATGSSYFTGFDDPNIVGTYSDNMGSGVYAHSGTTLYYLATSSTTFNFRGYLVPATAVPAASSQVAAEQNVQFGSPTRK